MNHFELQEIIKANVHSWSNYESIWDAVEQYSKSQNSGNINVLRLRELLLQMHNKEKEVITVESLNNRQAILLVLKLIDELPPVAYNTQINELINKNMSELLSELKSIQKEVQDLIERKESVMKILNEIDLQGVGKVLGIKLGSSIAPQVLPKIKELVDQNRKLVEMLEGCKYFIEELKRHGIVDSWSDEEKLNGLLKTIK